MTNNAKVKGSLFERQVTDWLNAAGVVTQRIPAGAVKDLGDLFVHDSRWPAIQCKNHARIDLAGWIRDAEEQAVNAHRTAGVVWAKRRGTTDIGRCYVIMTGDAFLTLMEGTNAR